MMLSVLLIASSLQVSHGIYTHHLSNSIPVNENNQFWSVEYRQGDVGYNLSTFNNSYWHQSTSVGVSYVLYRIKNVEFTILCGLVNGYTDDQISTPVLFGDWQPYIVPQVGYVLSMSDGLDLVTDVKLNGKVVVISTGFRFNW